MKKKFVHRNIGWFIFLSCLVFAPKTKAADVNFTITHEVWLPGFNGSIAIQIDPQIDKIPFSISIIGDNGYTNSFTTSDHFHFEGGLTRGNYCITITDSEGCTATECMDVKRCRTFSRFSICGELEEEDDVVSSAFMIGNGTGSGYVYRAITNLSFLEFEEIIDTIFSTIDIVTTDIETTGESEYSIEEQFEITEEADFIFKFTEEGEIVWVYQNPEESSPDSGAGERVILKDNKTVFLENDFSVLIKPNPFNEGITVLFDNDIASIEEVEIKIVDVLGRLVHQSTYSVYEGKNAVLINDLSNLKNGIYNLILYSKQIPIISKQLIKTTN